MQNRREVPRYMCELPARLSLRGGEAITNLTLIRLGIKGCATQGEGVPAVGQKGMIFVEWQGRQSADARYFAGTLSHASLPCLVFFHDEYCLKWQDEQRFTPTYV